MLREEIKQVEEIALIAAKTASIMAYNEIMAKISALGKRIDRLELNVDERAVSVHPDGPSVPDNSPPEPTVKKVAKKEKE